MTNPIGALFGRSPIRPIERHMDKAQNSVVLLGEFLQSCIAQDWGKAKDLQQQIAQVEQDADEMKQDIRKHLPKSLFLPFSRADLLELLRLQDRLPNHCRDTAHLLLIRQTSIPDSLTQTLTAYFQVNLEAASEARKIINELDELLESGFRGKEAELVEKLVQQLDKTERECEIRETALRQALFDLEDSIGPVELLYLDKLIEGLGRIMATSHRIGSQLLLIMAS